MAGGEGRDRPHVEDLRSVGRCGELLRARLRSDERPAVELDDSLHVRRAGRRDSGGLRDEQCEVVVCQRRVEPTLEPDGRGRLRAHGLPAQRAGDVTRVDLDAVSELDEPAQRVEETLGSCPRLDREIGSRGVADEQRVAGEDDPWLRATCEVEDREAAVLRTVPRCVDAAQDDVAERDLVAVFERIVRVLGLGRRVHAHRDTVLEREAPVPGEVVGVRVRLDHAHDAHVAMLGLVDVLLDRKGRIDDDSLAGAWIADEIRRTPERVVDELREDHGRARPYQRLPLFLLKCPTRAAAPSEHRDCDDREHADERDDAGQREVLRGALRRRA